MHGKEKSSIIRNCTKLSISINDKGDELICDSGDTDEIRETINGIEDSA